MGETRCAVYVCANASDGRRARQFREIRDAVSQLGWSIARVYREDRAAQAGADRPAWGRLQHDARQRPFSTVEAITQKRGVAIIGRGWGRRFLAA
jgi:hypothetical protein